MAFTLSHGFISKEGKLGFIFRGGGKPSWYPTEEDIEFLLESMKKYNALNNQHELVKEFLAII